MRERRRGGDHDAALQGEQGLKGGAGRPPHRRRLIRALVVLLAAGVGLGACRLSTDTDRSEELRILVDGPWPGLLEVITSSQFLVGEGEDGGAVIHFLAADTASLPLPVDQTYALAPTYQFAVRIQAPPDEEVVVTFAAYADGAERFRRENLSLEEPLEFYFQSR